MFFFANPNRNKKKAQACGRSRRLNILDRRLHCIAFAFLLFDGTNFHCIWGNDFATPFVGDEFVFEGIGILPLRSLAACAYRCVRRLVVYTAATDDWDFSEADWPDQLRLSSWALGATDSFACGEVCSDLSARNVVLALECSEWEESSYLKAVVSALAKFAEIGFSAIESFSKNNDGMPLRQWHRDVGRYAELLEQRLSWVFENFDFKNSEDRAYLADACSQDLRWLSGNALKPFTQKEDFTHFSAIGNAIDPSIEGPLGLFWPANVCDAQPPCWYRRGLGRIGANWPHVVSFDEDSRTAAGFSDQSTTICWYIDPKPSLTQLDRIAREIKTTRSISGTTAAVYVVGVHKSYYEALTSLGAIVFSEWPGAALCRPQNVSQFRDGLQQWMAERTIGWDTDEHGFNYYKNPRSAWRDIPLECLKKKAPASQQKGSPKKASGRKLAR